MRPRYTLPGVYELRPLRQGNLSSMCGLYSLLNGILLALYPQRLSRPQLQQIYRHAIGHLSRKRKLKQVLGVGIEYELWAELRDELIGYVNTTHDATLKPDATLVGTAAKDRRRAIDHIRKTLYSGSPILAGFGGALDHYSVICGYTEHRLMLFDSSSFHWIRADNLGLGEYSRRRHWILAECTSTLVDDW